MNRVPLKPIDILKIDNAYRKIWEAFRAVFNTNCIFEPFREWKKLKFEIDSDGFAKLEKNDSPIFKIINWPADFNAEQSKSKRFLDIIIRIEIQISKYENRTLSEYRIEGSSIDVVYTDGIYGQDLGPSPDVEPLVYIHYDIHKNAAGHPIFHAQFSNDELPLDDRKIKRFPVKLEELRIASAPMDLKAILFGLVNDHYLTKLGDLEILPDWRNTENNLPIMPCEHIRDQQNGRMKNIHWYPKD